MNEQQAFRAIHNAIRLEHLSDDLANRVNPELRAIFQELGQQFKAMPPGSIEREVWYRQARAQIGSIFAPLSEEMRDAVTDALDREAVEQMRYAEKYLSDGMRQEGLTVRAPQEGFSQLEFGNPQFTRQQLHTIAQDTRVLGDRMGDLFRPSLDEGGKWGKWIEQNLSLIDRKVKTGFLTGMTNEQIAATLPGLGREAVTRNKAIARTAVMDMSARSQEAFWAANSDRIRGFEVDSTMDNRVCDVCAPWDGEFSEVRGKLPVMPLHINCRCRVLPLSASELALRKEEGPQRRSVVELIEADSKEEAIAMAKTKPGVTEARAYARQVKVNGKKYWRVAEDIVRSDKPLTMAEFLRQASPATQTQVLGSDRRRSEFLKLIRGSADRPPVSAERALKMATEWRPTVTRRPRLSAQMRLDISKLKSQRDLMKKQTGDGKFGVYAYLREDGTPYYIGKMKDERRAFSRQHNAKPPSRGNENRVRLLKGNLTEKEAFEWEKRFIARYGRKDVGTGILRNLTAGGEGASGAVLPASAKATISAKAKVRFKDPLKLKEQQARGLLAAETQLRRKAQELGISFEEYAKMTPHKRAALGASARRGKKYGLTPAEWLRLSPEERKAFGNRAKSGPKGITPKTREAAKRHGMTVEQWTSLSRSEQLKANKRLRQGVGDLTGDLSDTVMRKSAQKYGISVNEWTTLSERDRNVVAQRYARGIRGKALIDFRNPRMVATAQRYAIDYEVWVGLSAKARLTVRNRYAAGKRGAALLEGLL